VTQPLTIRSACALAFVAAALGALGCGGAKSDRSDTTAAAGASSAQPPPANSVAATAAARQPGALPKPIDQMSGEELYTFTHGLSFSGGQERPRRCRGDAACRGQQPARSTRIRLDAVSGEDSLSAGPGLPPNGAVAVRSLNHGEVADTMYGMRPGPSYEYYLIVLSSPRGGGATWRLEELTTTTGSRSHRSIMTGVFKGCNHPYVRGARADFKTCEEAAPVRQASFSVMQGRGESPIWVGCEVGCCTADPPT
jgi:hypothetical protein